MNSELMLYQFAAGSAAMELIFFLSYVLVCAALATSRFSRLVTLIVFAAAASVTAGANIAVMLSGTENYTLILTLFPLTAYLPFSVLLYFLSNSGIFETAAVCSVGTLEVLILKSLQKILYDLVFQDISSPGHMKFIMADIVIVLAASGLVFTAFRFIGKAFRSCIIENRQNLLLSVPVCMIFLMIELLSEQYD